MSDLVMEILKDIQHRMSNMESDMRSLKDQDMSTNKKLDLLLSEQTNNREHMYSTDNRIENLYKRINMVD